MVKRNLSKKWIIIILIIFLAFFIYIARSYSSIKRTPSFITKEGDLYAHSINSANDTNAWNRWRNYSGENAKSKYKYFIFPDVIGENKIEIYNNYNENAIINGVEIKSKETAIIDYKKDNALDVKIGDKNYELIILKSDSDASVFINDSRGTYEAYNGEKVTTDLYFFLARDKRNKVYGSKCTIINKNDIINTTTLKSIKGRGNSSWLIQEKKPLNVEFNTLEQLGNTTSKKFTFISTTRDPTMLRNKIMFDLAREVGLNYSPNISYVDLYVNGNYKGCYTVSEKVDLGKNSLVNVDNNYKETNEFNFLVEVDVWNYGDNTIFLADSGYIISLKDPSLKNYNENNQNMKEKYDFIKTTYQKLDDALYKGTLKDLEKVCDIESLAKLYLLQEFGKNCDGGFTNTYFIYNAEEKKFYVSPIWDCDTAFGSYAITREGTTTSSENFQDWLTKTATFEGKLNPLAKAFTLPGTTSDGKTFNDICMSIWNEKFIPSINIILGSGESKENLKSIDENLKMYEEAIYNNYVMWRLESISPTASSGLEKEYSQDYNGEIEYLKDWIKAREEWITEQYNT